MVAQFTILPFRVMVVAGHRCNLLDLGEKVSYNQSWKGKRGLLGVRYEQAKSMLFDSGHALNSGQPHYSFH